VFFLQLLKLVCASENPKFLSGLSKCNLYLPILT